MKHRAVLLLLLLLASAAFTGAAAAQIIPGVGGQRPASQGRVRPSGDRGQRAAPAGQRAQGDTTPAAQQDSITDLLLKLEGYVPVYYQADSADYRSSDRTLRLRGASRVERAGDVITAQDSIVYQDRRNFVAAYGKPQGDPNEGEAISGDVFYYDLSSRRATVRGARTKITENATWYVAGDVTNERGDRIFAENSTFTSDDRADPAYHFKADRIMIIRNRILVGRPAYLYFKNVPVMALPFIVQDLEHGRRSGFLIPQFEINDIVRTRGGGRTSRGTGREFSNIGYYWAISPYLGLQLAGRWRSQSYTAMRGNLEFNVRRRFLNGNVDFEQFWQTEGATRLNLNGAARWQYNERTDLNLTLGYATSTAFERNRTLDPELQTSDLSSTFSFTRRLNWGNLSLNAERRQSIANDDRTFSPHFALSVNPIALFPSADRDNSAFYNNGVLTVGFAGSETSMTPGDALTRRMQSTHNADASGNLGVTFGNLSLATTGSYGRVATDSLAGIALSQLPDGVDSLRAGRLEGFGAERARFSVNAGFQQTLFASTRISPTIGFERELVRRDTTGAVPDSLAGVFGAFVAGPARLNVGASLSTDLYGFFPGIGEYSAIRHHIKPSVSYRYSPAVQITDSTQARIQRHVFGLFSSNTVNLVTLGLDQTFEGKVREPRTVRADSMADSAKSQGNASAPSQPRKVTLLAINTQAITYNLGPLDSLGRRFQNATLQNSVRTDLLGGLQFTMSHDLFEQKLDYRNGRPIAARGGFKPFLTDFQTSFSLGSNSSIFRWLGFARATEAERAVERGQTPDSAGTSPRVPRGAANFTGNNQQTGGSGWNLSLNYSLTRQRRSALDTIPGFFRSGNSQLGGTLTFQPTKNWAVSWGTDYSITTGEFSTHRINLKRDLYRWQANFDYILAPNGNTAFSFSVHLIDLPDLKADYQERSLGVDRPTSGNGRTPSLPAPVVP